jgi:hypothetical protein
MKKVHYVGLECISLDQMLKNMAELQGHKVIVEVHRFADNLYNLSVYGELPESWDWIGEETGDELWEGERQYEAMKLSWEKSYNS